MFRNWPHHLPFIHDQEQLLEVGPYLLHFKGEGTAWTDMKLGQRTGKVWRVRQSRLFCTWYDLITSYSLT